MGTHLRNSLWRRKIHEIACVDNELSASTCPCLELCLQFSNCAAERTHSVHVGKPLRVHPAHEFCLCLSPRLRTRVNVAV